MNNKRDPAEKEERFDKEFDKQAPDDVDEAARESFPASDPPAFTPVKHVGPPPAADKPARNRGKKK